MTTPPLEESAPPPAPVAVMTQAARRVLLMAEYEARLQHQWKIREVHLLLGLLHENDQAAKLLRSRGVTLEGLRVEDVAARVFHEQEGNAVPLRLSAPARDAVISAAEEAGRRGCPVGTPHLLYALLLDDHGLVCRTLEDTSSVNLTELRSAIWELLADPGPGSQQEGHPAFRQIPLTRRHGSAILGFFCGAMGVGLAYLILARVARGSGRTVDEIMGVFHGSWTLVVLVLGGVAALIPSRRRTGLGLLLLAAVGVVLTLANL